MVAQKIELKNVGQSNNCPSCKARTKKKLVNVRLRQSGRIYESDLGNYLNYVRHKEDHFTTVHVWECWHKNERRDNSDEIHWSKETDFVFGLTQ